MKPDIKVTAQQIQTLRKSIDSRLSNFKRKRNRNKLGFIVTQPLCIIAAGTTTVLTGFQFAAVAGSPEDAHMDLKNAALICSSATTALTAFIATFDYKALWVCHNIAVSQLRSLQGRLNYLESLGIDNIEHNDILWVFNTFEVICQSVEKDYKNARLTED